MILQCLLSDELYCIIIKVVSSSLGASIVDLILKHILVHCVDQRNHPDFTMLRIGPRKKKRNWLESIQTAGKRKETFIKNGFKNYLRNWRVEFLLNYLGPTQTTNKDVIECVFLFPVWSDIANITKMRWVHCNRKGTLEETEI